LMVNSGGCGLAAPQVGIPLQIITYKQDGLMGAMINPEITYRNPEMIDFQEGCLSFPGEQYKTKRHKDIIISFSDLDGKRHNDKKVDGFLAIILQHECDHLDGIVLPQHGQKQ
jgi:peptide deformylase